MQIFKQFQKRRPGTIGIVPTVLKYEKHRSCPERAAGVWPYLPALAFFTVSRAAKGSAISPIPPMILIRGSGRLKSKSAEPASRMAMIAVTIILITQSKSCFCCSPLRTPLSVPVVLLKEQTGYCAFLFRYSRTKNNTLPSATQSRPQFRVLFPAKTESRRKTSPVAPRPIPAILMRVFSAF